MLRSASACSIGGRLRVDAEQHGHVSKVHAGLGLLEQPVADPGSLSRLVLGLDEFHLGSGRQLCLESDGPEAAPLGPLAAAAMIVFAHRTTCGVER